MAVRLLSEEEQIRRSRAIQAVHAQWAAEQIAKGVDGPVPPGRPDGSDYNQHFPDMEASPEDEDDFWRRVNEALA
jgi:hypothetical protein